MKKLFNHYKIDFLNYLKNIKRSSKLTLKTYDIAITQMINIVTIKQKEEIYLLSLMPLRRHIAKLSKKTISKKLSAIRSFVYYLNDIKNINVKLKDDESIKNHVSLPKPIEHNQILKALLKANNEEKLIIIMLYSLGLRISELCNLEIKNIKNRWLRVLGKGEKMRDIPLSYNLKEQMKHYSLLNANKKFFFEKKGVRLSEDGLRYKLNNAFNHIGLKVTPHQLRHSFATELLGAGARIEDISELLGHQTIATTQIYTKLASNLKMENYNSAHPLGNGKEIE